MAEPGQQVTVDEPPRQKGLQEPVQTGRWIRTHARAAIKVLLLVVAVALLIYWARFRPVAVEAYRIEPGTVVAEVMGTGTLEAHVSAAVGPKIAGRIVDVLADENDRVRKGQMLARLDDTELKSQVGVAESAVKAAEATLARVKADRGRAEAVLELARITNRRTERLHSQSAATAIEVDTAREQMKVAEADLQQAAASIVEAQRQVATAEDTLRYQKALLDNTVIRSPFDGLVVRRDHVVGDVVPADTCIFQIVAPNELWASVWVDETALSGLSAGQTARVVFQSKQGTDYDGKVVRLGREVDRQTREFLVDIEAATLPPNWAVGQRVDAYVATAQGWCAGFALPFPRMEREPAGGLCRG